MSRFIRALSVIAITGSPVLALAQQPGQPIPVQPGQVQPVQPGQIQPGRPGQPQPGQPGQIGQTPGQAGRAGMQAQGVSLSAFIAHKLKRGNESEIELGQMAVDRAKDDSVKEFAQMMVKSHQQALQQLTQLDGGIGASGSARDAAGRENDNIQNRDSQNQNRDNQNRDGANRDNTSTSTSDGARSNVRNSESNTDGEGGRDQRSTSGTSQASSGAGAAQGTTAGNQAGQVGRGQISGQGQLGAGQPGQAGQIGRGQVGHAQMGGMSGHVPHMLVALTDQTCDNEQQLTKKMLQQHEGSDFDMAYIGQQIVAHTCMLAELQALKTSGPQELQQLVAQGEQTTQKHLDRAMKIAEELGSKKQ